jgi:hypothetical protein
VVETTAFFLSFYLTKAGIMLYYKCGGQMKNDKLWLLIDSIHKKLVRARYWTTSLDDYKQDIEDAIKALEEALKKIEEE